MDRSFRQTVRFIITSLIGAIALSVITTPTSAQAAAAQPSARNVTATTAGQVPQWVLTADRYVRVTNGVARVSPAIYSRLDRATVQQVMQAVAQFNALDQQYRMGDVHVSIPLRSQDAVIEATCRGRSEIRISTYWWGQQYWLSSCTVLSVVAAGGSVAAIAGIIASVCGACAPVAGVLAGVLALYTGWIAWADQYCDGGGVYVNRPWTGPVWISRVC
ncbi:MAG TPA: hypothetical protein VFS21_17295 [Roseiflexaceae bacterium]|nr:hypothetical protein [Roseiflexaceae bacterium]